MTADIGIPDLLAFADVLAALAGEADGMTLERAMQMDAALGDVLKQLQDCRALIQARAVVLAKEPVRVGDSIVHAEATGKWRPDQTLIKRAVASRACYDSNGEKIDDVEIVAHNAVEAMYDLFVAPKTMPKTGGLAKLRLEKSDVAEWEHTGNKLVVNRQETPE